MKMPGFFWGLEIAANVVAEVAGISAGMGAG